VILASSKRKLGLQEQICADHLAASDNRRDGSADRSFVVVAPLIGGVDPPESVSQGQLGQPLGIVLLPGGPVQEPRDLNSLH
jgi:hypothetical protein